MVCVVGRMRDLILQLSKSSIYSTKPLCGFDWGAKPKATSSNQQYWVVALLRELEEDGLVEQIKESGPWRLR
ncbi:hypothetical protein AB8T41_16310 [Klebsiella pneumoniae]